MTPGGRRLSKESEITCLGKSWADRRRSEVIRGRGKGPGKTSMGPVIVLSEGHLGLVQLNFTGLLTSPFQLEKNPLNTLCHGVHDRHLHVTSKARFYVWRPEGLAVCTWCSQLRK